MFIQKRTVLVSPDVATDRGTVPTVSKGSGETMGTKRSNLFTIVPDQSK